MSKYQRLIWERQIHFQFYSQRREENIDTEEFYVLFPLIQMEGWRWPAISGLCRLSSCSRDWLTAGGFKLDRLGLTSSMWTSRFPWLQFMPCLNWMLCHCGSEIWCSSRRIIILLQVPGPSKPYLHFQTSSASELNQTVDLKETKDFTSFAGIDVWKSSQARKLIQQVKLCRDDQGLQ